MINSLIMYFLLGIVSIFVIYILIRFASYAVFRSWKDVFEKHNKED